MNHTKIGIITFHNAHNYGAVLQAYALHREIELLGLKSEFIQNKENTVGNKYRLYPCYSSGNTIQYLKSWVGLMLDLRRKKKRHDAFERFISQRLPVHILADGKAIYDSVVLGSDQIWNFNITNGINSLYFGQDESIKTKNVISYAASMGNAMSEKNFTKIYKEKLSKLTSIGVREETLGAAIKSQFNLDYQVNLDPTLLLEKKEWDKLATCKPSKEDYLLVYEVEKHKCTQDVVDFLRKKMNLSVKVISSKINRQIDKSIITTASPEEFVSLFKNAKFVVTSSFHGTVFSIINEVPFYTLKFNNGVDLRSAGLLESLGLRDRHVADVNEVLKGEISINYRDAKVKLNDLRAASENYLKESLLTKN